MNTKDGTRLCLAAAVSFTLCGCPPEGARQEEQGAEPGSRQNRASGAGDDRRLLNDISGAERGGASTTDDKDREPGGR